MTMLPRPLQLALAAAAALAALASAGCNNAPADKQVSAGTHLDDAVRIMVVSIHGSPVSFLAMPPHRSTTLRPW